MTLLSFRTCGRTSAAPPAQRPLAPGKSPLRNIHALEPGGDRGRHATRIVGGWTRREFKGTNELNRRFNPTRIPIGDKESVRWVDNLVETTALLGTLDRCVHIGDRGADIYELFCADSS